MIDKKQINLRSIVSVLGGDVRRDRIDGTVRYNVGGLEKYVPDLKRLP